METEDEGGGAGAGAGSISPCLDFHLACAGFWRALVRAI